MFDWSHPVFDPQLFMGHAIPSSQVITPPAEFPFTTIDLHYALEWHNGDRTHRLAPSFLLPVLEDPECPWGGRPPMFATRQPHSPAAPRSMPQPSLWIHPPCLSLPQRAASLPQAPIRQAQPDLDTADLCGAAPCTTQQSWSVVALPTSVHGWLNSEALPSRDTDGRYLCLSCSRSFSNAGNRLRHMRIRETCPHSGKICAC